jgi:hypothetical protein
MLPLIGPLADLISKSLDRIIPDPAAKTAAVQKLAELQQTGELARLAAETDLMKGQLEVNKVEAASPLTFISGPRPFVMWVCGSALAVQFVVGPLFAWGSALFGHALAAPKMDLTELMPILMALLGLGGMRTYEKIAGVASK